MLLVCQMLHMPPAYRMHHTLPVSPPACQMLHMLPVCRNRRKLFRMLQMHLLLPSLSNQINLKVP
jgi:hypothetical protein